MWEYLQYCIIFVGTLVIAYLFFRVAASAWFAEKSQFHKRLLDEINKGDKSP